MPIQPAAHYNRIYSIQVGSMYTLYWPGRWCWGPWSWGRWWGPRRRTAGTPPPPPARWRPASRPGRCTPPSLQTLLSAMVSSVRNDVSRLQTLSSVMVSNNGVFFQIMSSVSNDVSRHFLQSEVMSSVSTYVSKHLFCKQWCLQTLSSVSNCVFCQQWCLLSALMSPDEYPLLCEQWLWCNCDCYGCTATCCWGRDQHYLYPDHHRPHYYHITQAIHRHLQCTLYR